MFATMESHDATLSIPEIINVQTELTDQLSKLASQTKRKLKRSTHSKEKSHINKQIKSKLMPIDKKIKTLSTHITTPEKKEETTDFEHEIKLPTDYQTFIHLSKYARWLSDKNRRESWNETVDRYMGFFRKHLYTKLDYTLTDAEFNEIHNAILNLEVVPSMRAMMTSGIALETDNIAGYNCSYTPIASQENFGEILYILMCGVGVGFSVEKQYIDELPEIAPLSATKAVIHVEDSKIGWATSLNELITHLYNGIIPTWDTRKVRPSGAPLVKFGGRSSGPEPLKSLFKFVVNIFTKRAWTTNEEEIKTVNIKLTSDDVHDIVCKIAEIVVVGGVRRSALLSLSDLNDDKMRYSKSGEWWIDNPQRRLANNSACYTEKPDKETFLKEWKALKESKSGERGIFNRKGAQDRVKRTCPRRDSNQPFSTNPCGEILLKNQGLCNLSEGILRPEDTPNSIRNKIRLASIIGTWQSTLTDFRFVSPKWAKNCKEERLLGVSMTGIMDNKFMSGQFASEFQGKKRSQNSFDGMNLPDFLTELKELAIETNKIWANKLKINPSVAVTTIKPSGTTSAISSCANGIHPRHCNSKDYFIRTVRSDKKDPLTTFMIDAGVPSEPCLMKPDDTVIFSFPMRSPPGSVSRDQLTAIQHAEICQLYNTYWCQHNVSVTINIREEETPGDGNIDEWEEMSEWVYKNFNNIVGMSFLPYSNHIYRQAPYQQVNKIEYDELMAKMPKNIDWSKLKNYEFTDATMPGQELACTANGCEL